MIINSRSTFVRNFFSLSMLTGINMLIPLLIVPFVINRIGIEAFGVVAIAQVLMIFFSAVAEYGFNITATKLVALNKENPEKLGRIISTVLFTRLVLTGFLFFVLLLAIALIPYLQTHRSLFISAFVYVLGQSLAVNWFFQGNERMHYITLSSLVARLIFVLLVFVLINSPSDASLFLVCLGLGNIVGALLSIFIAVVPGKLKLAKPKLDHVRQELQAGWQITVSNLSITTFLYSGVFILRIFSNDTIVGYYSVAERIFLALRQLLSVFSQVIYPRICRFEREGTNSVKAFFKNIYFPFLIAIIVLAAIFMMLAPYIIQFFVQGTDDLPVLLLRCFCVVLIIVCLNIPAYQIMLAFDKKRSFIKVYALSTLINISANLLLARSFGAVGTVISMGITELFITVSLNHMWRKKGLFVYK